MRPRLLGTTILTRDTPADPSGGAPAPVVTPAAPPPAEPPATPPAEPAATPPVEPPAPVVAQPKADWKDARIGELTAKLNDAKRQLAEKGPAAALPAAKPGESEADFNARVAAEAARIAAEKDWATQCNNVAAAGKAAFPDFDAKLGAIKATVNGHDEAEVAAYNSVLETAIETGKAHQLLYDLGSNPGEVRRLMGLSPTKRAMEMATMAAKIGSAPAAPDPSSAPKPLQPIGSHGLHYEGVKADDPVNGMKLPLAEWMAQREKQASERGLQ